MLNNSRPHRKVLLILDAHSRSKTMTEKLLLVLLSTLHVVLVKNENMTNLLEHDAGQQGSYLRR